MGAAARALAAAGSITCFIAALICVCAAIHSIQPFPEVAGVHEKWAHFERNKDAFDVLFIGSSRLLQHVVPERFDREVEHGSGSSLRSFNMAWLALWRRIFFWLTRRVIESRPAKLRWVFIDLMNIPLRADPEVMGRRAGYWHDVRHTLIALGAVAATRMRATRKYTIWLEHLTYLAKEMSNQGRGAELLTNKFGVERKRKQRKSPEWLDAEGYVPELRSSPITASHWDEFARTVEEQKRGFHRPRTPDPLRRAVADLVSYGRENGVGIIFLVTPSIDTRERFGGLDDVARVWYFDDPREHPALCDPSMHYDYTHLNDAGATLFTELVAHRFATTVKERN